MQTLQSGHKFTRYGSSAVLNCAKSWPDWIIIVPIKYHEFLLGFNFGCVIKVTDGILARNRTVVLLGTILNILGIPDSEVHGTNMWPIWGRQDPGGPHFGPMNLAIWDIAMEELRRTITMASSGHQYISIHLPIDWLFVSFIRLTS